MRRPLVVVGVALVAVPVLAGLGYLTFSSEEEPEPFTVDKYRAMCKQPRAFPEAAPRSDTPPHPVTVFSDYAMFRDAAPSERPVWEPTEPVKVQLIACVTRTGQGGFVKRCSYRHPLEITDPNAIYHINLYKGIYKVTVYEARLGRALGSTELPGDSFSGNNNNPYADPCSPSAAFSTATPSTGTEEGTPANPRLRTVLAPYVLK